MDVTTGPVSILKLMAFPFRWTFSIHCLVVYQSTFPLRTCSPECQCLTGLVWLCVYCVTTATGCSIMSFSVPLSTFHVFSWTVFPCMFASFSVSAALLFTFSVRLCLSFVLCAGTFPFFHVCLNGIHISFGVSSHCIGVQYCLLSLNSLTFCITYARDNSESICSCYNNFLSFVLTTVRSLVS